MEGGASPAGGNTLMANLTITSMQFNGKAGTVTGTFRVTGADAFEAAAFIAEVGINLVANVPNGTELQPAAADEHTFGWPCER